VGELDQWCLINGARDRVLARNLPEDQIAFEMELETVRNSLSNLMTFPFVKQAVDEGNLTLQGAYFSIISARLMLANDDGPTTL